MAFYETTFIVRPDLTPQQAEQLGTKFADVITEKKGKLIKSESWGLRNLAYRVKKHRKGHYVMLGFDANGAVVDELERQMRLSDDVIRFLSVRVEELTKEPSAMMLQRGRPDRPERGPRTDRDTDSDDDSSSSDDNE